MTLPLTPTERGALIRHLKQDLLDHMFGDGQEEGYVMNGISFKGLSSMTDAELLLELGHFEEGDSEEMMVERWRRELSEVTHP